MLLHPDVKLDRITEITVNLLNQNEIKAMLLDVDNTMSTHHGTELVEGLTEWIENMQKNGIKLTVLSNSLNHRIEPFAKRIGLPFISSGMKPLPFGFLRGVKRMGVKRKNTAIVGDQIFTDILGGSIVGVKTILLTPIKPEKAMRFRFKRWLEKKVIKLYKIYKTKV